MLSQIFDVRVGNFGPGESNEEDSFIFYLLLP